MLCNKSKQPMQLTPGTIVLVLYAWFTRCKRSHIRGMGGRENKCVLTEWMCGAQIRRPRKLRGHMTPSCDLVTRSGSRPIPKLFTNSPQFGRKSRPYIPSSRHQLTNENDQLLSKNIVMAIDIVGHSYFVKLYKHITERCATTCVMSCKYQETLH